MSNQTPSPEDPQTLPQPTKSQLVQQASIDRAWLLQIQMIIE